MEDHPHGAANWQSKHCCARHVLALTLSRDAGTTYAVEVEACKPGQPIYVFAMHSGQVQMQTCSRRATWIHSQAVLASHEEAAQPLATPTARKQAGSIPQLASDGSRPVEVMQTPQNGKKAAKATKRLHDGKQTTDKEKKTAKVRACGVSALETFHSCRFDTTLPGRYMSTELAWLSQVKKSKRAKD